MTRKAIPAHRSGCPINIALEIFGDRWSLLITRDLMVRGFRSFRDFQHAGEGIATNILADRLRRLRRAGIVEAERDPADGRQKHYGLTEKGIDLAPVLLELLIWGAKHEQTGAPAEVMAQISRHRDATLAETRRRWKERDPRPLFPWLGGPGQRQAVLHGG
ncbi:MAG: winged helix-turn-helix transcriptional regulator [Terriglobales bacterium]